MASSEPVVVAVDDDETAYFQWGPAIAGALAAAALAFVLHSFAAAMGLAVSSTAPTWRDSSAMLMVLTGLYLVLVALAAFGLGGYIAGRMRTPVDVATDDEAEFRDGCHGLLVWAIAILLTALMAGIAAQALTRLAAPSGGTPGSAQSVAGENLIAYDLDRLFRAEKRAQNADLSYARSEAARILLTATGHTGITTEDRTYLVRLTAANTGLNAAEADKRVATVIAQATENVRKARRSGVILAFMAGAAALMGAAVAWFAAGVGGRHRDGETVPSMTWSFGGPRITPARPRV